ncbi:MAG: ribosome biogenesis GTP-binding protein YihA/YsxC [Oscillospiraceae bacterium]|nr:ribosome biogenesis GTP-binding protein YihA/YsxC [Oscillospiraceae bacterium]
MNWNQAEFESSFGTAKQLRPCNGAEIAFAGRSNVGKSTLINKLFNRKNLARVSSVPGKTATINFYRCGDVTLVDLPGYGYAKTAKSELHRWRDLINGYLQAERDVRAVFQLVDMRHAPTKDDLQMIDFLMDTEMPFVLVLTKADKLNKTEREKRLAALPTEIPQFEDITTIIFSSMTGEGVEELRALTEEITVPIEDDEADA